MATHSSILAWRQYSCLWGCKELNTTEATKHADFVVSITVIPSHICQVKHLIASMFHIYRKCTNIVNWK